jgi:hypothetical protein
MAIDVHPGLHELRPGHDVRCWLYHDINGRLIPRPDGWVPRTNVAADEVLATGAAADAGAAAAGTTAATATGTADPAAIDGGDA